MHQYCINLCRRIVDMTTQSSLPKYVQISELLIREIAAGRLADGARLPPERDMAADLAVSVGTLRKALADLEDKGMLRRVQGSGNYVRAGAPANSVYSFFRLELAEGGGLPTAQVLSVDRLPKPAGAPDFGAAPEAHRVRRLRWLNDVPAALEEIWIDGALAKRISVADLSESIYQFYRDRLGIWITRAEDRVGLGQVPDWGPQAFPYAAGTTVGHVERVAWAQDAHPIEYSRTWFDYEKVRHISRIS